MLLGLAISAPAAEALNSNKLLVMGCGPRPTGQLCPPNRIWTVNPDGSALTPVSPTSLGVGSAAWSPDGTRIAFTGGEGGFLDPSEGIWVMNADGGNPHKVPGTATHDNHPSWAPDGHTIVFVRQLAAGTPGPLHVTDVDGSGPPTELPLSGFHPTFSPNGRRIAFQAVNGSGFEVFVADADGSDPVNLTGTAGGFEPDFSPNGQRIAFMSGRAHPGGDAGRARIWVMDADGANPTNFTNTAPNPNSASALQDYGPTWSPDGRQIAFERTLQNSDRLVMRKGFNGTAVPVTPLQTEENAPRYQGADWQSPGPAPIVFVHGFAGSKIACSGDMLFPDIPIEFPDMQLEPDGVTNRQQGTCNPLARPVEIFDSFLIEDVYGPTLQFLDQIAPGENYIYVWDWRKAPGLALDELDVMVEQALCGGTLPGGAITCANPVHSQVVLMGHSMGGLVVRDYINDQPRADKVLRALTVGTPYWGSPKAIFPLAAGVELPSAEALDNIIEDPEFKQWAQNAQGLFYLYPSANYGDWLTVAGREPRPLDRAGLTKFVADLGGTSALLDKALDNHAQFLDGFKRNGIDFQAFVGSGLPTIERVLFFPVDGQDFVKVEYAQGDGTVPVRSGTQGPEGTADPLGENVPIHYSCGVGHVALPGDPVVTPRIKDFLLSGAPITPNPAVCDSSGYQIEFYEVEVDAPFAGTARAAHGDLSRLEVASPAAASGPMTLEEAELAGLISLIDLGAQKIIVTDSRSPVSLTSPGGAFELKVTPLTNTSLGQTSFYPAVSGEATITTSGQQLTVADQGGPVTPRPAGAPAVSIGDTSAGEGAVARFTLTLSRPSSFPVAVDFATEDASAAAGSDYTSRSGTLVFEPGRQSIELEVATSAGDSAEPAESFVVRLSNPLDATIADGEAVATIVDGSGGGVVPRPAVPQTGGGGSAACADAEAKLASATGRLKKAKKAKAAAWTQAKAKRAKARLKKAKNEVKKAEAGRRASCQA